MVPVRVNFFYFYKTRFYVLKSLSTFSFTVYFYFYHYRYFTTFVNGTFRPEMVVWWSMYTIHSKLCIVEKTAVVVVVYTQHQFRTTKRFLTELVYIFCLSAHFVILYSRPRLWRSSIELSIVRTTTTTTATAIMAKSDDGMFSRINNNG